MTADAYVGTELELFAHARNWKGYFASLIRPHLAGEVLEVGAGIGGTTAVLAPMHPGRWVCLEPDTALAEKISSNLRAGALPPTCEVRVGSLVTLEANERFDTVLYVDVLEHVEDDAAEALRAAERLRPEGRLVVLGPAHQWLFSPFDQSIGHHRRYSRKTLRHAVPPELELVQLRYLDAAGLLASLANRLVLKRSLPTPAQIAAWDSFMVPLSKALDPMLRYRLGKSVFGVWRKVSS